MTAPICSRIFTLQIFLEDLFLDITGSWAVARNAMKGRLQIRGKPIRFVFNKKGKGTPHAYPNLTVFHRLHCRAGLFGILQRHLKVRMANTTQKNRSSSRHSGSPVGTGYYPVSTRKLLS